MSVPSGWEGILDEGEDILWQGRPDGAVVWKIRNIFNILSGLYLFGFGLVWINITSNNNTGLWMFGLVFFLGGFYLTIGHAFLSAYTRRNTWYFLTRKRAIIATDLSVQGQHIVSIPITHQTQIDVKANKLASVLFARKKRRGRRIYGVRFGFERIADGQKVYDLMRAIQEGKV